MQATLDNDLGLTARFNYRWNQALVTKTSAQMAPGGGQAMFSFDNHYSGADFAATLKAINPSILDGGLTGIITGSYMQSITPGLALGLDCAWQRQSMSNGPDLQVSYAARYKGADWIASAQFLSQGALQASYWRRLTESVQTGIDCTLQFVGLGLAQGMMGGMRKEGVTTIGARYDFRKASFRAQVDSQGKVACLLENRIAGAVSVTFSGEIDHSKVYILNRFANTVLTCYSKMPRKSVLLSPWKLPIKI
jgi:mitochondrial import receptor subunit TOM40